MKYHYNETLKVESLEEYVSYVRNGYGLGSLHLYKDLKPLLYECVKDLEDDEIKFLILGECFYTGEYGVEQDYGKAFEYYSKAAELGDARAQRELGHMYLWGEGVTPDRAKAREWLSKAIEPDEARNFGDVAYLIQDYVKAFEWYSKAAEQGDLTATLRLADMYEQGLGVTKDLDKASFWRKKADEYC